MQILHKIVNKALASLGYQKVPRFPQAGVGSGIIFYRADPNTPWVLHVSCAQRSAKVGAGWGIGCGGWLELASLPTLPPQTVLHDEDSALREGMEEIPGLFSVIAEAELRARLFYLTGFAVHVPQDPHRNYFHHAHELQSFRALADRADTNRLPYLKG